MNEIDVCIYVLIDPRDDEIRYVGATIHPDKRLWEHIHDNRKKCHRNDWIQLLLRNGFEPQMTLIETSTESEWKEHERTWIKYYRECGCDLTNATDGGDGNTNPSEEIRKKIGATRSARYSGENHPLFGTKMSDATKKKISDAHKGKKASKDTKKRLSVLRSGDKNSFFGKKHSDDTRKQMSLSHKGKPSPLKGEPKTDESKNNMSIAQKARNLVGENNPFYGKKHTDESKAKISATNKGEKSYKFGKPMSDSSKAKLSAAKTGKPRDEATKKKISATLLLRSLLKKLQPNQDTTNGSER